MSCSKQSTLPALFTPPSAKAQAAMTAQNHLKAKQAWAKNIIRQIQIDSELFKLREEEARLAPANKRAREYDAQQEARQNRLHKRRCETRAKIATGRDSSGNPISWIHI